MKRLLSVVALLFCSLPIYAQSSIPESYFFNNVYFVSTGGSDSNNCAAALSTATPKLTIESAATCLSPGDALEFRAGTYYTTYPNAFLSIPSGTSWAAPVTLRPYPGEHVVITGDTDEHDVVFAQDQHYIVFEDFDVDGADTDQVGVKITYVGEYDPADHIAIRHCDIHNHLKHGILITGQEEGLGSDYNQIVGNEIHHNGTDGDHDHGIYVSTAFNLVEGNNFHDDAAYEIHNYAAEPYNNYNTYRNNWIHGRAIIATGSSNNFYNNVIWEGWLEVAYGGGGYFAHNTFVDGYRGIYLYGSSQTPGDNTAQQGTYDNNFFYGTTYAVVIEDSVDTSQNFRNNLQTGNSNQGYSCSNCSLSTSSNLTGSYTAGFVNYSGQDFRITSSSSAKDAGRASFLSYDRDFGRRTGTPDIGAYEYRVIK